MISDSNFAYVQARIQARHGARLTDAAWRRLETIADLTGYLYALRETSLAPWVKPLTPSTDIHTIEQLIASRWSRYVERVASWTPRPWRPAVAWCAVLPLLPTIRYRQQKAGLPRWFGDEQLFEALLPPALTRAGNLDTWTDHWQSLWPRRRPSLTRALATLQAAAGAHLKSMSDDGVLSNGDELRAGIATTFARMFRRCAQSPVAVFCHLGLTALDVERMRGGLALRRLFATGQGGSP